MKKILRVVLLTWIMIMLTACGEIEIIFEDNPPIHNQEETISLTEIPEYSDEPFVTINNNMPGFTEEDYTEESYEYFSELDSFGRCGVVIANVGQDIMPTEDRESIGQVKPSGWQTAKYDNVDGKYLYNRCHLIGFQLTGENANEKNLITGTRYMNVDGMLPFENMVADYVKETGNHVLYRVTPIYDGDNLLASGVQIEAWSVEDNGDGICFNVYVYNIQPGIDIDYATGKSWLAAEGENASGKKMTYILNTNNKKFHTEECSSVKNIKSENKEEFKGTRVEVLKMGYEPCGNCTP